MYIIRPLFTRRLALNCISGVLEGQSVQPFDIHVWFLTYSVASRAATQMRLRRMFTPVSSVLRIRNRKCYHETNPIY